MKCYAISHDTSILILLLVILMRRLHILFYGISFGQTRGLIEVAISLALKCNHRFIVLILILFYALKLIINLNPRTAMWNMICIGIATVRMYAIR